MNHPQPWEIEAWVDEGSPLSGESVALARHVEACPQCAREIAWLRTERRLFAARASGLAHRLPAFERIEDRLGAVEAEHPTPTEAELTVPRHEGRWAGFARAAAAGFASAAALALVGGPLGSAGVNRAEQREESPGASLLQSTWLDDAEVGTSRASAEPVLASMPTETTCSGESESEPTTASCEDGVWSPTSCEMP